MRESSWHHAATPQAEGSRCQFNNGIEAIPGVGRSRRGCGDPGVLLYDRNGRPSHNPGCYTGATCPGRPWHAVRIVRRKDGSAEMNLFFDADKKLIDIKLCGSTPCFD